MNKAIYKIISKCNTAMLGIEDVAFITTVYNDTSDDDQFDDDDDRGI